ncbi:hypothetical protein LCGC14_2237150 [marine sediment metagenome]|uniref:Uncharacterized protein n=1 Tax=marine sediment metagenome TaxID=412755 RepID=A0A0F9DU44_9ZZZZ
MTKFVTKDPNSQLASIIKGYYIEETSRSLLLRLPNSISFLVPKRYIDSPFTCDKEIVQEFIVEDYILKKIGLPSPR